MELVVTTVIINFFGTIWGSGRALVTNLPIRWFYTGMVFYFLTCLQCSMQVTLTFQTLIHFTDWVVGHAHLVMFGVFSMWLFGMMTYLFPRLLQTRVVQPRAVRMALLAVGGRHPRDVHRPDPARACSKGYYWASLQPWDASVDGSQPFWIVRVFAGLAIIAGQFVLRLQPLARPGDCRGDRSRHSPSHSQPCWSSSNRN